MIPLTPHEIEKMKADYLARPYHCPYCRSDNIAGGILDQNTDGAEQMIQCLCCKKTWTDILTLTGVVLDDIEETDGTDGTHSILPLLSAGDPPKPE